MGRESPQLNCLFCHGRIPSNDVFERFPVGRRIAFDPDRGRLWAVCPSCRRWNLAPLDRRREAIESLERAARDRGRLLVSTDSIALLQVPGAELVRVGDATLPEEAWWRYGRRFARRRTRARAVHWAEQALLVGASIATAGGLWIFLGSDGINRFIRWRRLGSLAWRGDAACAGCGAPLTDLTFKQAGRLRLDRDPDDEPVVLLRCRRCRALAADGEIRIEGAPALHILRRVLTYYNFDGAPEADVRSAAGYIESLERPRDVVGRAAGAGLRLDDLLDRGRRTESLALEIALNEDLERQLLQAEVAEIEARWREAEEIAAIVDGVLSPGGGLGASPDEGGR